MCIFGPKTKKNVCMVKKSCEIWNKLEKQMLDDITCTVYKQSKEVDSVHPLNSHYSFEGLEGYAERMQGVQ